MKTIQEYLKEADVDRLVKEYFKTYPIKYEKYKDEKNLSIRQIREIMENRLMEYIHRLQAIEIIPDEDNEEPILFAHKYLNEGFEDITYSLVYKQELLEKGPEADTYAYEFSRQAEIMGYLVSDADFTQKNIYGLMVEVLYETSFFGYEQEDLEDMRNELDEAIAEIKSGKCVTISIEELFGDEKKETDEIEKKLHYKYMDASINYNDYCKKKEMEILKQLLLGKEKESLADFVYYDDAKS
jgi:hypothetical protein